MRTITIDKLKPFVFTDKNTKDKLRKDLLEVHTADTFSIASNSYMVGIIYNSDDHELHYTFGDSMDTITSAIKQFHNQDPMINLTVNRKHLLDTITEQLASLKETKKGRFKTVTKLTIDSDDYKLYSTTFEDGNVTNAVAGQTLDIDIEAHRYATKRVWSAYFDTKYFIEFLKFMSGYEVIKIQSSQEKLIEIRCEEQDREVLLIGIRMS